MFTNSTILAAHEGKTGPFIEWLKKLGLNDFLKRYPLVQLVEWGWIIPQYRVIFPKQFFESWKNYPCIPYHSPDDFKQYAMLWGYAWSLDEKNKPYWFLDDLFRPGDKTGEFLRQHTYKMGLSVTPEPFNHDRGISITPYVDYFYRWQGYALVDVIRWADNIESIYSTPDVVKRVKGITYIAEWISSNPSAWPQKILTTPQRWAGLASPMMWLDHFRSFRSACINKYRNDYEKEKIVYQEGAKLLAKYFAITPEILIDAIKNKLLVLAKEWIQTNEKIEKHSIWTMRAWPHLQSDILLMVNWLTILTGRTFEDYVTDWRLSNKGNHEWAMLDEVLPYHFIKHQEKFIRLVPEYLKPFNEVSNDQMQFNETNLYETISQLSKENYTFIGFLAAFHEMHTHLNYLPFDKHGLDFRELRPLDHYTLLAIHAEGCLRRKLDSLCLLNTIKDKDQSFFKYIQILARNQMISEKVIGYFSGNKDLTRLHTNRNDPIGRIQSIKTNLPKSDHMLTQAFLCCVLARNYFAHHDFLDHELIRSEKSAFMLRGILLTVLILLNSRKIR